MDTAGPAVERHGGMAMVETARAVGVSRTWAHCFQPRLVRLVASGLGGPEWSDVLDRVLACEPWLLTNVALPSLPTRRKIMSRAAQLGRWGVVHAVAADMLDLDETVAVHSAACRLTMAGAGPEAIAALCPRATRHLLRCACSDGNVKVARWAARYVALSPGLPSLAARGGHLDVLQWLVSEGLAPVWEAGGTWLVLTAASHGHVEMLRWLVEDLGVVPSDPPETRAGRVAWRHASLGRPSWWRGVAEKRDASLRQASHRAAVTGNLETLQWLLRRVDPPPGLLMSAVGRGYTRVADWLETTYPDASQACMVTALTMALGHGYGEAVAWASARLPAEVVRETMTTDVSRFMLMACSTGCYVLARTCWEAAGRFQITPSIQWRTPLMRAVGHGASLDEFHRMREFLPEEEVPQSVLVAAAEAGRVDVMGMLLGDDVGIATLILVAQGATRSGRLDTLEWLDGRLDGIGWLVWVECFHFAVSCRHVHVLHWLRARAAPPPLLGLEALASDSAEILDLVSQNGWPGVPGPDDDADAVWRCGQAHRVHALAWLADRHTVAALRRTTDPAVHKLMRW